MEVPARIPLAAVLPGVRPLQLRLHRGGGDLHIRDPLPLLRLGLEQTNTVSYTITLSLKGTYGQIRMG